MQNTKQLPPIAQYLKDRENKHQRIWRIIDGQLKTLVGNHWVNEKGYDQLFKPFNPITFVPSRENIDGTSSWIRN